MSYRQFNLLMRHSLRGVPPMRWALRIVQLCFHLN
ncbi:hypothetical protein BPC006_II2694 [Burkholderia pseudomallei BPC006]|nr:hypothetical protein BPC006_II2694 [Burkholderia pseudomallei BPC006]